MELLQERIGYRFQNEAYLLQALTHPSHGSVREGNQPHNQRLEFFGDALIAAYFAEVLYREFPEYREGRLTAARAYLIQGSQLAGWAQSIGLAECLRVAPADLKNGLPQSRNALEDAFEALVAALYLDGGWDAVHAFLQRIAGDLRKTLAEGFESQNPKGCLQQALQSDGEHPAPRYEVIDQQGPSHAPQFHVRVYAGDLILGEGQGSTKKEAEVQAAAQALKHPFVTGLM